MNESMEIANRHGLKVIEDCAQAHGAKWQGKKVGAWGDIAAWSFYPTKNLGGFGDGGVVTSNSQSLINAVKQIGNHGYSDKMALN